MNPLNCLFTECHFDSVYSYLVDLPLHKLIMLTMQVMSELSSVEALNYNINKFCQCYDDRQGRIAFLKKLVDDGIIIPLQYPYDAQRNPQLQKMLSIAHYSMQFPFGEDTATGTAEVLTDDLAVVSGPVNITNPRWERKREKEVKAAVEDGKSADSASFGDTIILMVDVTGMPEGSGITFDIYETSEDPPMCVATTKGKIEKGVGKGEWVVTDKSGKGEELKLAFEGIVKSKASEQCEIKCIKKEIFGYITICLKHTLTDDTIPDIECVLKGEKIELKRKADHDGIVQWSELPIDDYIVEINVNNQKFERVVFWKNGLNKIQVVKIRRVNE